MEQLIGYVALVGFVLLVIYLVTRNTNPPDPDQNDTIEF